MRHHQQQGMHEGRDAGWLHYLFHRGGKFGHHAGHRGQGFGGGLGGFDGEGDDDGMPRSRKFRSADLQLMVLALLNEAPCHGYELIKALETRSNGFYVPSPGVIYPALTYLEELNYVTVESLGNRKRFTLADLGREHLAANRERVDMMLDKLSYFAGKMDSVRQAYAGQADDAHWSSELAQARHAFKRALFSRHDAPLAEQRRLAAILVRATAEIESQPPHAAE